MEKSEKQKSGIFSWKGILIGATSGILLSFVFLFISAFLINIGKIPIKSDFTISIICICAAFLCASIISAKTSKHKKFLSSVISCGIMLAFMTVCGIIIVREPFYIQGFALCLACALAASLVGSSVCVLLGKH